MKSPLSSTVCGVAAAIVLGLLAVPLSAQCTQRAFAFKGNNDGKLVQQQGN